MIKLDQRIVAARARHDGEAVTELSRFLLRRDLREYTVNDVEHALDWPLAPSEREPAANDGAS